MNALSNVIDKKNLGLMAGGLWLAGAIVLWLAQEAKAKALWLLAALFLVQIVVGRAYRPDDNSGIIHRIAYVTLTVLTVISGILMLVFCAVIYLRGRKNRIP